MTFISIFHEHFQNIPFIQADIGLDSMCANVLQLRFALYIADAWKKHTYFRWDVFGVFSTIARSYFVETKFHESKKKRQFISDVFLELMAFISILTKVGSNNWQIMQVLFYNLGFGSISNKFVINCCGFSNFNSVKPFFIRFLKGIHSWYPIYLE